MSKKGTKKPATLTATLIPPTEDRVIKNAIIKNATKNDIYVTIRKDYIHIVEVIDE